MEAELINTFLENGFSFEDTNTAQQYLSLCSTLNLTPSQLVDSWEIFYLNAQLDGGRVLASQVDKFRVFLQTQQREAFRKQQTGLHFYTKDEFDTLLDGEEMEWETHETLQKTPTSKRVSLYKVDNKTPASGTKKISSDTDTGRQMPEKSPITPFSQRTARCTTQFVFNEHLQEDLEDPNPDGDLILHRLKPIRKCEIAILGCDLKPGCRYMCDRVENRFKELERRIQRFSKVISERNNQSVFHHAAYASQEQVVVLGRICCDAEGHLNDKSVLLEGSVEHSGGHRVRLDLHKLSEFSLFPGQVVAVEGHNPSGHCLIASQIIDSIPLPLYHTYEETNGPSAKRLQMQKHPLQEDTSQPICILAAAGPFTTSDNLAFEPLVELLSFARKRRPNILLLMGPFIDAEHPHIKQGIIDKLFTHLFQEEIINRVEEYCEEMGDSARVVLVPSCRDIFHERVFPQPPFESSIFGDPGKQITLLTNPGVLYIDEQVTMACCTTDVLRHLSSEEASRVSSTSSDRMLRLAAHIVGQRSFYPLFPGASGLQLDLSIEPKALDLPCTPDIIFLPSDLVPFAKVLSSSFGSSMGKKGDPSVCTDTDANQEQTMDLAHSIIVNSGRVAKGIIGGTFAELYILPSPKNERVGVQARTKITVTRV